MDSGSLKWVRLVNPPSVTLLFAVLASLGWVFQEVWQPQTWVLILMLSLLVSLLGLPHGAMDPWVAHRKGIWSNRWELCKFLLLYLLCIALALSGWFFSPAWSLVLFLVYSVVHFSGDWMEDLPLWSRLGVAGSIISAPSLLWQEELHSYFSLLSGHSVSWVKFLPLLFGICLFLSLFGLVHSKTNPKIMIEIPLLLVCSVFLHPLLLFIVYFCGLHSPRHLFESQEILKKPRVVIGTLAVTAITVLAAWLLFPYAIPNGSISDGMIRTVFIGLAVLTVPHMLLVDGIFPSKADRKQVLF